DQLWQYHLASGKGEELSGEISRPATGALNLDDVGATRVVDIEFVGEQGGIAGNAGDQVVEIMGHTAGESTDCLQSLGICQTTLEFHSILDVAHHTEAACFVVEGYQSRRDHPLASAAIGSRD